jgi:Peptidase family S41/PDZ domain
MKKYHNILKLVTFLFLPLYSFANFDSSEAIQSKMISNLEIIQNTFDTQYAPKEWKYSHFGWELKNEMDLTKEKIVALPNPSLADFHHLVKGFFRSTRDYHANAYFYSTAISYLPFSISSANGKFFISWVDNEEFPKDSNIKLGNEIITYNGIPISKVFEDFKDNNFKKFDSRTNEKIAEIQFTLRTASTGVQTEEGEVALEILEKSNGESTICNLKWKYVPEEIPSPFPKAVARKQENIALPITTLPAFHKKMSIHLNDHLVNAYKRISTKGTNYFENPTAVGSRKSFVPKLGKIIWESPSTSNLHAYIFKTPDSHSIGYIRIPTYMPNLATQAYPYESVDSEILEFMNLIQRFQFDTDALVIDQVNNGGGDFFYMYALLSMLTDRPLQVPSHRVIINQADVAEALQVLDAIKKQPSATQIENSQTPNGYFIDSLDGIKSYFEFIVEEWKARHTFSSPNYLFGIEYIKPHLFARYTKPILTLVNSLDFSCADFFPAILQDNQRAKIFGTPTAGAGGYVLVTSYPNNLGIKEYTYTASIAERPNGQKIEDLGVIPDVVYEVTETDLQDGRYSEYRKAVNDALRKLLGN